MSDAINVNKQPSNGLTQRPSALKKHSVANIGKPSAVRFSQEMKTIIYNVKDNEEEAKQQMNNGDEKLELNRQGVNEQIGKSNLAMPNTLQNDNKKEILAKKSAYNRRQSYIFGRNRYEEQLSEFLNDKRHANLFINKLDLKTNCPSNLPSQSKQKDLIDDDEESELSTKDESITQGSQPLKKSPSQTHSLFNQSSFKSRERMRRSVSIIKPQKSIKVLKDSFSSSDRKSFEQFFLLSVTPESFFSASFDTASENNYLDPFISTSVDLFDQYPSVGNSSITSKSSFTVDEISQCCFSSGVKLRLVPRCCLDGAKRLGWAGRDADKYQLHTLTNEAGVLHYVSYLKSY